LTAKGKPLKDHLDIKGHNEAIDFLLSILKDDRPFTEADLRALHRTILVEPYKTDAISAEGLPIRKTITIGEYKKMPNHVLTQTGEIHYYATPEETPAKVQELLDWYHIHRDDTENVLPIAVELHHRFAAIHPFDDGNGRMARLLMNLVFMRNGYPPVIIRQDKEARNAYYDALSKADIGDLVPFAELIGEQVVRSLEIYKKGALGENINEPTDLEKELDLFKRELKGREDFAEISLTPEIQAQTYEQSIKPFFEAFEQMLRGFEGVFSKIELEDKELELRTQRSTSVELRLKDFKSTKKIFQ
jgi:Fic family protein